MRQCTVPLCPTADDAKWNVMLLLSIGILPKNKVQQTLVLSDLFWLDSLSLVTLPVLSRRQGTIGLESALGFSMKSSLHEIA